MLNPPPSMTKQSNTCFGKKERKRHLEGEITALERSRTHRQPFSNGGLTNQTLNQNQNRWTVAMTLSILGYSGIVAPRWVCNSCTQLIKKRLIVCLFVYN